MRLFRDLRELPAELSGGVVAIGNFDGVHRGHQAVIAAARAVAAAAGCVCGVLTFEPHPRNHFRPGDAPFRLTPLAEKVKVLEKLGVDFVSAIPFDGALADTPAERFVHGVLLDALGARHIIIGYDFVFGKGRKGDAALLRAKSQQNGFGLTVVEPAATGSGVVYSASAVRDALREGRVADATDLLGRPWMISGPVQKGESRGAALGFPTANLDLGEQLVPALGVYAVRACLEGETESRGAVANLGRRPTFGGDGIVLEVHILDFSGDLYGRTLEAELIAYLRPETKFDGLESLKAQIAKDCEDAQEVLAAR